MMAETITPDDNGVSRLDITVGIVVAVLVVAVLAVSIIGHPAQAGDRIAYLAPADSAAVQNIYLAAVDDPDNVTQITDAPLGVYNYDVSDDGRYIAYAARNPETRYNDIWLVDLYTDQTRQLTNCSSEEIDCRTPVFRPDSTVLVYERQSGNTQFEGIGAGAIRVWLLDYLSGDTVPLTNDSQTVGHSPEWSDDGSTIAFYSADIANPGIYVYEFETTADQPQLTHIPSAYGAVGDLSPNGNRLIYPDVTQRSAQQFGTYLKLVALHDAGDADETTTETGGFVALSDISAPYDDTDVEWYPDGEAAAILRRYSDDRYTPGFQIYRIETATQQAAPVLVDERYNHSALSWDAAGSRLLMQRFPLLNAQGEPTTAGRPQIWLLDTRTDSLQQMSDNAFLPQWVAAGR